MFEIFWTVHRSSVWQCQEVLQTEVKPETVLFRYLRVWNWSFDLFICMDDKADEILSGRIFWNSRRSNLPFLDPSWKNKFDSVVFCFCLQKLWNLNFLLLKIYLQSSWNFKALMIVMSRFEFRKSWSSIKEILEPSTKMSNRITDTLTVDFF